jgi:predicted restriction endonuclease
LQLQGYHIQNQYWGNGRATEVSKLIKLNERLLKKPAASQRLRQSNFEFKSRNQRYVPSQIKQQIKKQADYRCQFQSKIKGERCHSRIHLEIDHRRPISKGGQSNIENLQLLCRAHNQLRVLK